MTERIPDHIALLGMSDLNEEIATTTVDLEAETLQSDGTRARVVNDPKVRRALQRKLRLLKREKSKRMGWYSEQLHLPI